MQILIDLGVEKQKTMDELKRFIIEDFQALQLDNKFQIDFEQNQVYVTLFCQSCQIRVYNI